MICSQRGQQLNTTNIPQFPTPIHHHRGALQLQCVCNCKRCHHKHAPNTQPAGATSRSHQAVTYRARLVRWRRVTVSSTRDARC